MKVKLVIGAPCSGKSTYVKNNVGDKDLIYDYERILKASTNRIQNLAEPHIFHWLILDLRKNYVELAKENNDVENLWLTCCWKTEYIKSLLNGIETEEIFLSATKEECYQHLENDDTRPDKEQWQKIIDEWFNEHSGQSEVKNKMNNFWNWKTINKVDETTGETITERELRIEGVIASESWFDDDVTPKMFRDELNSGNGNITVWINSYGGDVFAGSQIYTMLKEYKGNVAVKIDGIAASAASVIAMGGDKVSMAPTACMMIHDPSTLFYGNIEGTKEVLRQLNEIKESIITAYEFKTKLPHDKISKLMTDETMMSAKKALELGFADEIMYSDNQLEDSGDGVIYSQAKFTNCLIHKIQNKIRKDKAAMKNSSSQLYKRLNLLAP